MQQRRAWACLCLMLPCLAVLSGAARPQLELPDVLHPLRKGSQEPSDRLSSYQTEEVVADGDPRTLELCECEPAQGSPNGLSCQKEGWFISNFQQAGQWLNGGGLVPLSHAICCRPCLPKDIPGASNNETAVALVSLGCHKSSNPGSASLRCEATGGSFVTGWSEAVRVPDSVEFYYPTGSVDCCTPSLLLSNGEARELERCECVQENDINCGGQSSHRLLSGYMRWGISQFGEFVPIAPALCCKSCISDKVIPVDTCFDLNYCSGHGVCNLGACECAEGYGGADCKHRVGNNSGGLPQWLVSIIILASCATFSVIIMVIGRVVRYYTSRQGEGEEEASEEGEQLREPLIIGLDSDDEGSVGSQDTTDCDSDDGNMPPPIRRQQQEAAEEAVGGGTLVRPEEEQAAAAARTEPFEISHEAADRQEEEPQGASEEEVTAARIQADEVVIEGIRRAEALQNARGETASGSREREGGLSKAASQENLKDGAEEARTKDEKDRGGLPGIDCSVCLNRPVQVAVVPCGHMCMCRRCSRRLQTCPVCRSRILRRQRIFIGG